MSTRDKKLLIYLGALIILAAAYFLVGRPFLDKIDQLSGEKGYLEDTLRQKREAFERQDEFRAGIESAQEQMQAIIDKFPEDNTDEKSIMFIYNAETEIPIWVARLKFAEETQNAVSEGTDQSASDIEGQQLEQNVAAAEGEEAAGAGEEGGGRPADGYQSVMNDLIYRDTELGIEFASGYEEFKKFLEHIRDYEDRLVIKDIEVTYDNLTGLVRGSMVLSQYALLGPGRELPKVESGINRLGTENVFIAKEHGDSMLAVLADEILKLYNRILGDLSIEAATELNQDYFIRVTAVTDNTNGKTIGRADDINRETYIFSDENGEEDISFLLSGSDGSYTVKYSVGDKTFEDHIEKDKDAGLHLRIASTDRMSDSDKVSARIHVINDSDMPMAVSVEGDDEGRPRIDIVEKDGDVTVK